MPEASWTLLGAVQVHHRHGRAGLPRPAALPRCGAATAPGLCAAHLVLLLNMLIALMARPSTSVATDSWSIWKLQVPGEGPHRFLCPEPQWDLPYVLFPSCTGLT